VIGGLSYMKKILIAVIIIIGFIAVFPTVINWYTEVTTSDKILRIGQQVDETKIDFVKEIKDEEKIIEYENLIKELVFSTKEWDIEDYPDLNLHVMNKKGYITDVIYLWIGEDEGIVVKSSAGLILELNNSEKNLAKLTKQQLKKLREII